MSNSMFDIFRTGALSLASETMEYAAVHANSGFNKMDWELITSKEIWVAKDRHRVQPILKELLNISMTISGIPAQPLPAQYLAALVCVVVSPCNRMVASTCLPEAYNAVAASGLEGKSEIRNVEPQVILSLIVAYSSQTFQEPNGMKINKQMEDESRKIALDNRDRTKPKKV